MTSAARHVGEVLEGYAARGFLYGLGARQDINGRSRYELRWHYDRMLALQLDTADKTVGFPAVLPAVPARSEMYRCIKKFLSSFSSGDRPAHRSVDTSKARVRCNNVRGTVAIKIDILDGDVEYATRKLINIVHELFVVFLREGPCFDYRVRHLGLNPDADWG